MNHPGYYGYSITEDRDQEYYDYLQDNHTFTVEKELITDPTEDDTYMAVIRRNSDKTIVISYECLSSKEDAQRLERKCWNKLSELCLERI